MSVSISSKNDANSISPICNLIRKKIKIIKREDSNKLNNEKMILLAKDKSTFKLANKNNESNDNLIPKPKKNQEKYVKFGHFEVKNTSRNKLGKINPVDYNTRLTKSNSRFYKEDITEKYWMGSKLYETNKVPIKIKNMKIRSNTNNFMNIFQLNKEEQDSPNKVPSYNELLSTFISTQYNEKPHYNCESGSPGKKRNDTDWIITKSLENLNSTLSNKKDVNVDIYPKNFMYNKLDIIFEGEKLVTKIQRKFRNYLLYKKTKQIDKVICKSSNISKINKNSKFEKSKNIKVGESPSRIKFNIIENDGTPFFRNKTPSIFNSPNIPKNKLKENFITFAVSRQNSKIELRSLDSFQLDNSADNKRLKPFENNIESSFRKSDISIVTINTSSIESDSSNALD